ncbi:LssY C-terminal domain-containing protein [Actinomycetaceae bacterium TAE3-ERU4]|nr:LssY C-terminal domain-containing protein [Actinomycetaceae bacterium TAE3-ERU4]
MSLSYPIPSSPPQYHLRQSENKIKPRRIYRLLDSTFALLALFMSFWFALTLFLSGLEFSWESIFWLASFWLVLTYLVLPRMHQLFTALYLPDYFIARTKTGDGLLGDPINLAILGNEDDIHAAMTQAGWTKADPITLRSSLGIIRSSLTGNSYPQAPVSNLYLFDKRHNFAYQQEVDGSASQRHHVRFWKTPKGWTLPGGIQADWLAAGSYDKTVGLSSLTLQVTHKIDANIDEERDYIINTVRYKDPLCSVNVIENFSSAFHDRNGGGDAVQTDGNMPILNLGGARLRADKSLLNKDVFTEITPTSLLPTSNALDKELPPPPLTLVGIFIIVSTAIIFLAYLALADYSIWSTKNSEYIVETVINCITILLYVLTVKKHRWARISLLSILSLASIAHLILLNFGSQITFFDFLSTGTSILMVLALTAPSVREWVDGNIRRRSGGAPIGY